jgi:alginate O-acetyltransferase complex protein AlgI
MVFNSIEFFLFFAVFYCVYRLLPFRGQNRLFIVAGYLFYGWWDVRFLTLLAFSTALDFSCGSMLGNGRIPWADRVRASLLALGAAFAFGTVRWDALTLSGVSDQSSPGSWPTWAGGGWGMAIDWGRLLPDALSGWWVSLLTAVLVLLANLLYYPVRRLPARTCARVTLVVTIVANLVFLGIFKYFNFFIDSFDKVARLAGTTGPLLHMHIILPVGISFYTFQSMSYTIDVYRGKMEPVRRFWDYVLFVAFFPPLVAGPIERAAHLIPQLLRARTITLDASSRGLYLIALGLFKKVAIADGLAGSVDSVFGKNATSGWADIVVASLLFAMQIYCDFSGYTDIARGVAKLLGFDLIRNFNLPYVSRSPAEFWQRWHISLSTWLRDYLYIPLGGNRYGKLQTYRNLMITMLLGGLWHGAAWNYVLWGAYHGLILCLYRLPGDLGERPRSSVEQDDGRSRPVPPLAWVGPACATAFFFALTCYGWLLFRATSLDQVIDFTRTLISGPFDLTLNLRTPRLPAMVGMPLLVLYEAAEYAAGSNVFYRRLATPIRGAWYATLIFVLIMGSSNEPSQFIYFQF